MRFNQFLPYPVARKQASPPLLTVPPATPGPLGDIDAQHALAHAVAKVLEKQAERDIFDARRQQELMDGPKPKKLDDRALCNLLGWCGLAYHEREYLPKIWTDLLQCST